MSQSKDDAWQGILEYWGEGCLLFVFSATKESTYHYIVTPKLCPEFIATMLGSIFDDCMLGAFVGLNLGSLIHGDNGVSISLGLRTNSLEMVRGP